MYVKFKYEDDHILPMKNTIVAGSFQKIHDGHKALLNAAFASADFVYIGLMTDEYVRLHKDKCVPYESRKIGLINYLDSSTDRRDRYIIEPLKDAHGDALYDSQRAYESITVSTETLPIAQEINAIRESNNQYPLVITLVPLVRNEIGDKLSSTDILNGKVDNRGVCKNRTEVVFLGTTGGLSSVHRACAGILVRNNRHAILLDCGNDTGLQLIKAKVNQDDVDAVFISHAHIDHYIGLPMLVFHQMMMYGRRKKLYIRAPIEVINIMKEIQSHYFQMPFEIDYGIYGKEYTIAMYDFRVTPFEVVHSTPNSFGFVIRDENKRKIVYSGDSKPCMSLTMACNEADLIIHEATYGAEHTGDTHGHSTIIDAINTYRNADRARIMYLTHISIKYHSDMSEYVRPLGDEPNIYVAEDLDVVKL